MLDIFSETTLVALVGLCGGFILGLAARMGRFCTLGAIEDLLYGNNDIRMRMWGVAIGVAVIGTFLLVKFGQLDLSQTLYLGQGWNLWACVIGGLLFGYGMALCGNCGFGALARLGGGDLRSFVIVLVMGLASYMTLSGPLASLRVTLFPLSPPSSETTLGIAGFLSSWINASPATTGLWIGAIILVLSIAPKRMHTNPRAVFWSSCVGLAIISGWAGTYWVARHGFDATPVVSHTFSAPIGESMLYIMTASGRSVSFGVGSVTGVLIGAFIGSLIKGHFRWEACDDPRELQRQILGAAIMGIGAVTAIGCSIGQGLSAFSVLSYSAPITFIAIISGAALGLKQLIIGFAPKNI